MNVMLQAVLFFGGCEAFVPRQQGPRGAAVQRRVSSTWTEVVETRDEVHDFWERMTRDDEKAAFIRAPSSLKKAAARHEIEEEEEEDDEWSGPMCLNNRFSFSDQRAASARDWLHNLKTWPSSQVLRRIKNQLVALIAWSALVAWWGSNNKHLLKVGMHMHTLVGGALSLLLVFRTNTAYQRYWEGQKIFDKLSSHARDLADFVAVYRCEVGEQRCERISALLQAYPMALQLHLQGFKLNYSPRSSRRSPEETEVRKLYRAMGGGDVIPHKRLLKFLRTRPEIAACMGVPTDVHPAQALNQLHWLKNGAKRPEKAGMGLEELSGYYAPLVLERVLEGAGSRNMAAVLKATSTPLAITSLLSEEAKAVPYTTDSFTNRERLWLLSRITSLRAALSASERLVQTPVPLHYARHTSRFLCVWCFTLPLCLCNTVPAVAIPPVIGLVAWSLLGLREIGLLIENPFKRSLELTMVTDTLANEIKETFTLHRLEQPSCEEQLMKQH